MGLPSLWRRLLGLRDPAAPDMELISIHVPKTAGSSFRRILESVYANDGEFQPVYDKEQGMEDLWQDRLPDFDRRVRAIHGHFPATRALLQRYPRARLIAWLRDPVDRTISYYHYWQRIPSHGNPAHDQFLAAKPDLLEFASHPMMQQEMLEYFKRIALQEFFFIGFLERFDQDLEELADRMEWALPEIPRENSASETRLVDAETMKKMRIALSESVDLYQRVKRMRGLPV